MKLNKPSTPQPSDATEHSSSQWYKDKGTLVFDDNGRWERCQWGDSDPLDHLTTLE